MADDDDRPRLKIKFKLDSGFLNTDNDTEEDHYSKPSKDKKKKKKKRKSDEEKKIKKSKKEKKAKRYDDDQETVSSLEDEPVLQHEISPQIPDKAIVSESVIDNSSPFAESWKAVLLRFVGELEKLDPNGIFADPVTDAIAPGYSTLIRNPMDLSTIKAKLDNLEYPTTVSLRSDMILMLDNCTKYNTVDTPFHQLALKLEKDVKRIVTIKRAAKFLKKSGVDPDGIEEMLEESRILENEGQTELSVDSDNDLNSQDGALEKSVYSPRNLKKVDWAPLKPGTMELTEAVLEHPDQCSHTDTMDVVDVLKSVTRAAAEARERLSLKYPGEARLGYIKHAFGGKMEFTTISDGSGERGVRMPIIPVELETPEPEIDPVEYLTYGPYGQYKPTYDNRLNDFFNLNQEKDKDFEKKNELARLKKIYGGERELGYVQSIQYFVEDMEKPAVEAAEEVLIKITRGLHETTRLNKMPIHDIKMDFKALESLKSLGIDTSWLEAFNSNSAVFKKAELIDKTLQEAAELMSSINQEILRGDISDEAKECIKEQVGLLNKMLKTMIPLYGTNIAGKGQQLVRHQQKQVHVKSEPHHVHPQEHTRPNQIQTQVHVKQEIVRESTGVTLLQPHAHVKQETGRAAEQTIAVKIEHE